MIANTPQPPYYAVIFSSVRTNASADDYALAAAQMVEMAAEHPGFLGVESACEELGITVSYWESLEAIRNWKMNAEHTVARDKGRAQWYRTFKTRICLVERDYGWEK